MAEHRSYQERTEQPTPKRLREARERGQVARSRELSSVAVMVSGAGAIIALGPHALQELATIFRRVYQLPRAAPLDTAVLLGALREGVLGGLWAVAPILALVSCAALAAPLALGGWVFSGAQLQLRLDKLNPLQGFKRMFSLRALMELGKALGKFLVVAVTVALLFGWLREPLLALRTSAVPAALHDAAFILTWAFLALACALVVIAAVDAPFQLAEHRRQLRMTRQELREELKETEGKPEVRGRIRQLQQQLARARMLEEVPRADVVITNPTHVSVALRYDERRMRAPQVVAKGVDLIALRIREVAERYDVAMVAAPLLARVLNASTQLRQEIPAPLHPAVAQVLAFVYQLRAARQRGAATPEPPVPEVPETFVAALRAKNKVL